MFTKSQIEQIKTHKQSIEQIEKQIQRFCKNFPFINILSAATLNKGIIKLNDDKIERYIEYFENEKSQKTFAKFVPASGAATRMFKRLFEYLENPENEKNNDFYSINTFFENIDKFAFIDDLKLILLNETQNKLVNDTYENKSKLLNLLLSENGLGYGSLPKGLLKFHQYEIKSRTAVEEHLVEGALYAASKDNTVKIHFTVSPQFLDDFKSHIEQVRKEYEQLFEVKYKINYSIQEPSTDTIAVNEENQPIIDKDGNLIFRPAGHGALIENLNKINDDIIFIKNIDNVVPDRIKETTVRYKKALSGLLLNYQNKTFSQINILKKSNNEETLKETIEFLKEKYLFYPKESFNLLSLQEKKEYLLKILNRPIRVCGMVKNENEPGGGPFIVKHQDGSESLQIIESVQIDSNNAEQKNIALSSTHFNPVDIICGVKDYEGNKFDLSQFIDEDAGIITLKSHFGKKLKALELPGLWNGAMANWNTVFVEVPLETFNPVKEINDLLRTEHQQQ